MKKLCLVLVPFVSLAAFAVAQAAAPAAPSAPQTTPQVAPQAVAPAVASTGGQVVEEIITRVNNQIITRSEYDRSKDQLRDEVKQQDSKDPDKNFAEREKDVLRDLVDQQLLSDKAKDLSITGDTDLIKRLDQMRKDMKLESLEDLEKEATKQGVSWEDFKQNMRNQIITQKVIGEEVSGHLSVSKEEEQKFYDDHKRRDGATRVHPPERNSGRTQDRSHPRQRQHPRQQPIPTLLPAAAAAAYAAEAALSTLPKPRPTISSSRFTMAPVSRTSPRNTPTVPPLPMAAISAPSSAASSLKQSRTRRLP